MVIEQSRSGVGRKINDKRNTIETPYGGKNNLFPPENRKIGAFHKKFEKKISLEFLEESGEKKKCNCSTWKAIVILYILEENFFDF